MDKIIKLATITLIIFVLSGCEKEDQITMEIDGKKLKSISIESFDIQSDSSKWKYNSYGIIEIDTIDKFNGKSSLHLACAGGCFRLERIEGVPVDMEKIYMIHFNYKYLESQVGDTVGGCVGDFMIWLMQGNETLLLDGCLGSETWSEQYFYFQPINNVPVKIIILVGTYYGVWLDDMVILEEY